MTAIPRRKLLTVYLLAPLVVVPAGIVALLMAVQKPNTSQDAPLIALLAFVLWIMPAYVVGALVTWLGYATTSPTSRHRKSQVFVIHLAAGVAIGALLGIHTTTTLMFRLIWVTGAMGAVSGALAAVVIPEVGGPAEPQVTTSP